MRTSQPRFATKPSLNRPWNAMQSMKHRHQFTDKSHTVDGDRRRRGCRAPIQRFCLLVKSALIAAERGKKGKRREAKDEGRRKTT